MKANLHQPLIVENFSTKKCRAGRNILQINTIHRNDKSERELRDRRNRT